MKCPSVVSRSPRSQEHEGRDGDASSLPVDKVIVDPLKGLKGNDDDNSATEELWGRKLEMMVLVLTHITFSIAQTLRTMEKSAVKGQTKGVINSRQIKVIDNDTGNHTRPMPGMIIFGFAGL
ncbi:hypothetical protein H0E87_016468 [Populus deltoides]|uniref:Uncharacterized protein n=1 Tax=Populus deltoides TaxID=3696 RepID=A0A8T2Y9L6_POPDE|nr:hypothetical protein H0E87_016468 [Populus deltoides]KAH8501691.1 hypothetical protein H0E87_016468 [Populus deltoides]KAH8501692.1 hypothetical protein H0E87_016468 [Populus deltoides]KAH8501693.1 hypothetical protein H0E87_016468 [Populus deltoides]